MIVNICRPFMNSKMDLIFHKIDRIFIDKHMYSYVK